MSDKRTVVVVTGGRHYTASDVVFNVLDDLHGNSAKLPGQGSLVQVLYHGACGVEGRRGWRAGRDWSVDLQGADGLAHKWALSRGVTVGPFPAFWDDHGQAAGPIRNGWMLGSAKTYAAAQDLDVIVVAFPGLHGTADCVKQAKRYKMQVIDLRSHDAVFNATQRTFMAHGFKA